jgi:NADPH:quinone reductase-like Zn-dependent oxidoreductase
MTDYRPGRFGPRLEDPRRPMKAIVHDRYGPPDVLELADIEEPRVDDDDGVLVRVRAASVNPADWHLMRGEPRIARLDIGLRGPKHRVLGCDLAGEVEAVGANVKTLKPGDEVFGSPFGRGFGALAEACLCASEDLLESKPANLTFEQAAAAPLAGMTALQALRDHGRIEPGHRVLIIGASGGVGTFAVQIAKSLGAEVTGVCSTRNVDLVGSLGADRVIDYTEGEFIQDGQRYDLVFQVAGTRSPSDLRRALTSDGTLVPISGDSEGHWIGPIGRAARAFVLYRFVSQRVAIFTVKPNGDDLRWLKELIEAGEVTPVIDRTHPLQEVPGAIRYLEQGRARGKIVITV